MGKKSNVSIATKGSIINLRHLGLAASLFVAYDRAMEVKREREQAAAISEWQGEIGKRTVFTLKCEAVAYSDGQYGTTSIYRLTDEKGNRFTWFSSRDILEKDETYKLKASVKEHSEYQGVKQTVITRCKVE